jgi:DNA-binding NtrC family response regulator
VLARGSRLTSRDIPRNIRESVRQAGSERALEGGEDRWKAVGGTGDLLANAERQMIETALRRNKGNRTKAAQELGISRRTLHRKLNRYRDETGSADA